VSVIDISVRVFPKNKALKEEEGEIIIGASSSTNISFGAVLLVVVVVGGVASTTSLLMSRSCSALTTYFSLNYGLIFFKNA
jgi:hypothetical protein